jgi:hypothetical protein
MCKCDAGYNKTKNRTHKNAERKRDVGRPKSSFSLLQAIKLLNEGRGLYHRILKLETGEED